MLKKILPCLALLLLLGASALAEEATDLIASCDVTSSGSKYKITQLTDNSYRSQWVSDKKKSPYVQIETPSGEKAYGVYVCFGDKPFAWQVQAKKDGKWVSVAQGEGKYAHEYLALDGLTALRITPVSEKSMEMCFLNLHVFGEGDVPSWVNQWQDAPEKVDLLVISAHPDDEFLFFGGAIPYYAGELGKNVMVAYMTCNTMQRRSELLDALWSSGARLYPDIGDFWDKYAKKIEKEYEAWGKTKTNTRIVEMFRKYKPDVVITHDVKGEYGHAGHLVCADAVMNCIAPAGNPDKYTASASQYGAWAVKKVYLHLYKEGAIEMDWDQPLTAFGGQTGFEIAQAAYKHYVSQQEQGQKNKDTGKFEYFAVEPRDSDYSCYRFGLAYTAVGPDVEGNDFFENVE